MNLLAISTSGPQPSAALFEDEALVHEALGQGGKTHSETIMPLVEQTLAAAGLLPNQVDIFAVDIGPGSFTGVRIGVCAANAMAMASGRSVAPVSSLRALVNGIQLPACALLDCRNGNGYALLLDASGETLIPESAVVVSDFLKTAPSGTCFVGDGALLYREEILCSVTGAHFCDVNAVTASNVGKCALGHSGESDAMPLYLRPSQAERLYQGNKSW